MNFQQAAISWFGLPEHTRVADECAPGQVAFVVTLTAEDLAGIAQRMQVQEEPARAGVVDWERLDREQISQEQLREDYAALTPAERGKYGSFGRYKAHRQAEQFDSGTLPGGAEPYDWLPSTEGVGGRKVRHVDVAEEPEAVTELPAAVWVQPSDLAKAQFNWASDHDDVKGYLMQVDMLTAEQKAKYCGEQKS